MATHKRTKQVCCLVASIVCAISLLGAFGASGQKSGRNYSQNDGSRPAPSYLRENSQGNTSSPYTSHTQEEILLPDYRYRGTNLEERLVYQAHLDEINQGCRHGFLVTAVKILGSYRQGNKLKLFARVEDGEYRLYGNELSDEEGGSIPAAITFTQNADGTYKLEKYETPDDGSFYAPSIRRFCTQPVSGEEIPGLADKVLDSVSYTDKLVRLKYQHLADLLHENEISNAYLPSSSSPNKILFSLKNYS